MRRAIQAALVAIALAAPAIVLAQQPKPRPSAAPSGSPNARPPGHPGVDPGDTPPQEGLPAGHPPVADDEDAAPSGQGPPPDTSADDPSLPPGTIVVTIKDGQDQPMPHAPVTLSILRSSVTKGDSTDRRTMETDGAGAVRFDGVEHASGTSFHVTTSRGAAKFGLPTFVLGPRVGKRGVLHSYESSAVLDNTMLVFMRAIVAVTLHEDSIQVEHLISVFNIGKVAWLADLPFALPDRFKAFNKEESMDDARVEEVPKGAALRGTFPPGKRDLVFHYQIPLDGDASQAIHLRLPDRVTEARVLAESSKTMGLEVQGFPPAQRVTARDGKRLLLTERAARSPGEASVFDITLTGLPTHGPGRIVAVVLAVLALIGGIAYAVGGAANGVDPEARKDLAEARDALLRELVVLERAHKDGEVGPKTYARVRASLLDALARIVGMIEAATPRGRAGKASQRSPRRAEEST